MMRNATIGKKIGLGFGVVMALLVLVGGLSYNGFGRVLSDAEEVIDSNKVDGLLAQRELDHLVWTNQVSALLTDDSVTELDVQTDDHQCAFGKWLYGDERAAAEATLPSLAPLLKQIEGPHAELHASAVEIDQLYEPGDIRLPGVLTEKVADHLKWAAAVRAAMIDRKDALGVQTDATKCVLGQWIGSEEGQKAYREGTPAFRSAWDAMLQAHQRLHASAVEIEKNLVYSKLAAAERAQQAAVSEMTTGAETLFAALEKAMEDIVDPAKERAAAAGDVEALERWANVDMIMNEKVIQVFVEARLAVSEQMRLGTDEQRQVTENRVQAVHKGADEWINLLAGTEMAQVGQDVDRQMDEWTSLLERFQVAWEEAQAAAATLHQAETVFRETTLPALEESVTYLTALADEAKDQVAGRLAAERVFAEKTRPSLVRVRAPLKEVRDGVRQYVTANEAKLADAYQTRRIVTGISLFAVAIGSILAFFISRGIVKTLKRIVDGLNEGADQVNDAAGQVSSAAQQSAEGASEQASSLEETSSALEQMAAMTRTNAENAKQANTLSEQARAAAQSGDHTMGRLNGAMSAISESSGQISKIIKVIEEIAFQTNLLALNAAVEAARAGEHGKGFAVVADEVRNLAQRAAQAARETTGLIENSVNKAKEGTDVASEVGKSLSTIVGDVTKVTDLINGISKASEEQAQGVDQVNTAVSQMDKVTQQNAAGAEESASAAEQLAAQAANVKGMVEELAALVGSASKQERATYASPKARSRDRGPSSPAPSRSEASKALRRMKQEPSPAKAAVAAKAADDFIPLDNDGNLNEF